MEKKIEGFKLLRYADEVAILVTGKYISTVKDLMESAPANITRWEEKNDIDTNKDETQFIYRSGNERNGRKETVEPKYPDLIRITQVPTCEK